MATSFDSFETMLMENVSRSVLHYESPEIDDPMDRMIDTMPGLGKGGRRRSSAADGYVAEVKMKLSRGGAIKGGTFAGHTTSITTTGTLMPGYTSASFPGSAVSPDPLKIPIAKYETITADLKRLLGNVVCDMQKVLADLQANEVEEVAVDYVDDANFQLRNNILSFLYSDGTGMLAKAGNTGTIAASLGASISVGVTDGTFRRFIQGQRYELYQSSGWPGTKTLVTNGSDLVLDFIDDNNGNLYFTRDGAGTVTVAVGDILCLAGTISGNNSLVPSGIEYMFKTSGEFFGIADVANIPQLKAYVTDYSAAPVQPEPEVISKEFDKVRRAGKALPTMIISERALLSQYCYLEKAGYATYTVPNMMPQADGGISGAVFTHGKHVCPWDVSDYIRPGMLWATAPESIKKFMPLSDGGLMIRWWNARGSGSGIPGIFVPVNSGTQQTELWQAPFDTSCEFMTDDPKRNVLIKGLLTQLTG